MKNASSNAVNKYEWRRFKVLTEIGKGSFGRIWMGLYNTPKRQKLGKKPKRVAIKFEKREKKSHYWLLKEARILKKLKKYNIKNVPHIYWYGIENGFNVMVMTLYNESLLDIKSRIKQFSLQTVLMIGLRLIDILEAIHSCGIIHCDIKPSNLLLTENENRDFNLIDFGLSKEYLVDERHIKYKKKSKKNKSITGTALFCSLNCHTGNISRRDDLESVGFLMIYFLNGGLPWQGIRGKDKYEKYWKIFQEKLRRRKTLTRNLDEEFNEYFKYVRGLKFEETPDYDYLRGLLHYLMVKKKIHLNQRYDWVVEEENFMKFPEEIEEEEFDSKEKVYYVNHNPSFWKWFFQ